MLPVLLVAAMTGSDAELPDRVDWVELEQILAWNLGQDGDRTVFLRVDPDGPGVQLHAVVIIDSIPSPWVYATKVTPDDVYDPTSDITDVLTTTIRTALGYEVFRHGVHFDGDLALEAAERWSSELPVDHQLGGMRNVASY